MLISEFLLFPIHYQKSVVPFSVTLVGIVTLLLISMIADLFYHEKSKRTHLPLIVFEVIKAPFLVLLICFATYAACDLTQLYIPHALDFQDRITISFLLSLVEAFVLCWIIFRAVKVSRRFFLKTSSEN